MKKALFAGLMMASVATFSYSAKAGVTDEDILNGSKSPENIVTNGMG